MKPLQPPLRYVAERPENGVPTKIAEDVWWVRAALPFALDHVNIWLLRDDRGWVVIDCGFADDWTRAMWERLLSGFLADAPVSRVIATHFHPDHVGLAGWLCERTGAQLLMARSEWLTARMLELDDTTTFAEIGEIYDRRAGLDEAIVELRKKRGNMYRRGVTLPSPAFTRLRHSHQIPMAGSHWQVIIGEGHAPEMLTFYCEERRLLITADQILPRITPIVGVWPMAPDEDPLEDFTRSLDHYREIPETCSVLPSHDGPFEGLQARIDQLIAHHHERLDMTREACREPVTVAAVLPALFKRKVDIHQLGFAIAETLAHINHLMWRGEVRRHRQEGRADLYQIA